MRKPTFLLLVLPLFLLVPASITWAQTISQAKGLTTAVFTTNSGKLTVYLPGDFMPGDQISGTVLLEPAGKARQAQKNLEELGKHQISIAGERIIPDLLRKKFKIAVIAGADIKSIGLYSPGSVNPDQKINLPETDPVRSSKKCLIPTHALTGETMSISGPFDGDASTTTCLLDNNPLEILAETPRQAFISYPANAKGIHEFMIRETNQEPCSKKISGVDMQVSAGKLNLLKGETTYIDVLITGLEDLPDVATLTLTNLSTGIVNMMPSNLVVIPFPPDSLTTGTFQKKFDIQSLRTGTFNVNINLDLPQPMENANPTDTVPPGYVRKSCECSASVTISKTGGNSNSVSFKANAIGACTGQYGIGINTFPRCTIKSIAYGWGLGRGKENVEIRGTSSDSLITISKKNNNGFIICVKVKVICIDGTICEAEACSDQDGNPVDGPGTTTRPEDPQPPTVPTNPTNPTTTERRKCKCICTASATIVKIGRVDSLINYKADVKADCKPEPCPAGAIPVQCGIKSITYNWAVTSGAGVVIINGPANGPAVTLKIIGKGGYVLTLTGTVTCLDGTICHFMANLEDIIGERKLCSFTWEEKIDPLMDGGLMNKYRVTNKKIRRDDFLPLGAEGKDVDLLRWICEPVKPDCEDTRSEKTIPLNSRVRFEWNIVQGNGRFVKLGCLPGNQADVGEHVIFMPPVVPPPVVAEDTSFSTDVRLSIIDDNPTQIVDTTVNRTFTVVTKRKKADPNYYYIDVVYRETHTLPATPNEQFTDGSCKATGVNWTKVDKLAAPAIELPDVTDKERMVLGQWILLSTDVRDIDNAEFKCESKSQCTTSGTNKDYEDDVRFTWTASSGNFISDAVGRYVIYEAPMEMPPGGNVTVKVVASNPGGASPRKDRNSDEGQIILNIYQPGVKLSSVPADWVPEDDNFVELTSELKYRVGNDWQPALAHMCRVHFFELKNVTTERGICMNEPVQNATLCRDLQLRNEDEHEAFDDTASNCRQKGFFIQARTKSPVISYSIKVYSNDFGSFGLLRSFANVNRGGRDSIKNEKPVYISIPIRRSEVSHPQNRPKKTEYGDNRVTIPHDIDENHIADVGWTTTGGIQKPDPERAENDEDNQPAGDSENGDGLSNYEEYRGFKIKDNTQPSPPHIRTNYSVKDIFINNVNDMPVGLYTSISGLDVHSITPEQYNSDRVRIVNFNYTTTSTHIVDQMGLRLVDRDYNAGLLGIVHSVFCPESNARCNAGRPSPPNWIREVRIYTRRINESCTKRNLNRANKLAAVVAHELLHANNVCHHGESEGDPEDANSTHDNLNGTRSGNVNCVMRYDNVGTFVNANCVQVRERDAVPEAIGNSLCTSPAGTGYNTSTFRQERRGGQLVRVEDQKCFGNAAERRGDCIHQIRVSGRGWRSSSRQNAPLPCGNRGL